RRPVCARASFNAFMVWARSIWRRWPPARPALRILSSRSASVTFRPVGSLYAISAIPTAPSRKSGSWWTRRPVEVGRGPAALFHGLSASSFHGRCKSSEFANGRYILRRHHHRLRPRRLRHRDPRGAARLQDRDHRKILSRRYLPELGLHPDKSAAALRRDLSLHAARQGLRALRRKSLVRSEGRRRALAR